MSDRTTGTTVTGRDRPTVSRVVQAARRWVEPAGELATRAARRVVHAGLPVLERADRRLVVGGLRAQWNPGLHVVHESIERVVADPDDREMHRILASVPGRVNVVVFDADRPLGVVTLRRRPTFWEPTMYQCLAGPPLAIEAGRVEDVLRAVGVEIRIEGYEPGREQIEPDEQYAVDSYVTDLTGDYEAHWHRKWRANLRTTRKRCAGFELRIDAPEDLRWAVTSWRDLYADDPRGEVVAATDRLALWPHLGGSQIRTVALCDGDRVVACTVSSVRGLELSFQCTARDPEYDRQSVGSHILDRTFQWAKEEGYERFDLGAGYGYKQRFAPVGGTLHGIAFQPPLVRRFRRLATRLN